MKTALVLVAAIILAANSTYATPVPDSCLRMYLPNDGPVYDTTPGGITWHGSSNPDSVMIDTCSGSSTYNHLFAKKWFYIQFPENYYPFDHGLDSGEVRGVSDIDSSHLGMLTRFLELQDTLGLIYFLGYDSSPSDSILMLNPSVKVYFENYQDITFIKEYIKNTIDSIESVDYILRAKQLLDVSEELEPNGIMIYPNPVVDYIVISQDHIVSLSSTIEVLSVDGKKVLECEYSERIDVSMLHSGSYFLRINNQTIKFIKE